MPEIAIELVGTDLDAGQLDSYDKLRIVKNAETVWVKVEITPPSIIDYLGEWDYAGNVPADACFVREPVEEYIQAVEAFEEVVVSSADEVYATSMNENYIQMSTPFEEYEEAKAWADEMETRVAELPSRVRLHVPGNMLPTHILEGEDVTGI